MSLLFPPLSVLLSNVSSTPPSRHNCKNVLPQWSRSYSSSPPHHSPSSLQQQIKHIHNPLPHHHHRPSTTLRCSPMTAQDVSSLQFQGSLSYLRAYWVTESLIAWNINVGDGSCYLYASKTANLDLTIDGIQGYDVKLKLESDNNGLPVNVKEKFPHIQDYNVLKVPAGVDAKSLLKCQLAVVAFNANGERMDATGLQLPGILDDLFSYSGPLGAVFSREAVSLYLWAPTAQTVRACIYKDPSGSSPIESIQLEEVNGVWSGHGPRSWEGCYYVYEVSVYHPSTSLVEQCIANDPYARGLSSDGRRTLLVNLNCDSIKPEGWDKLVNEKPELSAFPDISIYELHIRDFSANDHTVQPHLQGGYLAFTCQDSAGIRHLKKLHSAGLTHVHLLPAFQFASVVDEKEKWKCLDVDRLATLAPDSDEQQAQVTAIQDEDGYNWG